MWITKQKIEVNGETFIYDMKQFDEGSEYGIEGGRISKLFMKSEKSGSEVCCYDRGWDRKPRTKNAKLALELILHMHNH